MHLSNARVLRYLLLAVLAALPLASGAQVAAPEGLPSGTTLYQIRDVRVGAQEVGVVEAAYSVGEDGTVKTLQFEQTTGLPRALAVVADGASLRLTGGRDVRSGWVAVEAGLTTPVWIEGQEIAHGSVHLRLAPGVYTFTFGGDASPQRVQVQSRTVVRINGPALVAQEARTPDSSSLQDSPRDPLSPEAAAPQATVSQPVAPEAAVQAPAPSASRRTPPPPMADEATRRQIATSPFARGRGGETVVGGPLAGWSMPVPEPQSVIEEEVTSPSPTPPPPRQPFASRPPPLATPPPALSGRDSQADSDMATCPAPDGSNYQNAADELIQTGEYEAARACLMRYVLLEQDDIDAIELNSTLDRVVIAERAMAEETRTFLKALRSQVLEQEGEDVDLAELDDVAARLLAIFPGDPATVRRLRKAHALTIAPGEGAEIDFVYIPGAAARLPNDLSTRNIANPPAEGYLLSAREITNAQFAHFLNGITKSDEPYLIRRPEHLVLTRTEGWQPLEGAENLPVVDATWFGAFRFAEWSGGRLPNSTEWEWAYRMGGGSDGSDANLGGAIDQIRDVNASQPDDLGLHDMLGNVWEWLESTELQRRDRPGAFKQRSVAGGSFRSTPTAIHSTLVSVADGLLPNGHIGFRVFMPASGDGETE